jgi:hypothetical protein
MISNTKGKLMPTFTMIVFVVAGTSFELPHMTTIPGFTSLVNCQRGIGELVEKAKVIEKPKNITTVHAACIEVR